MKDELDHIHNEHGKEATYCFLFFFLQKAHTSFKDIIQSPKMTSKYHHEYLFRAHTTDTKTHLCPLGYFGEVTRGCWTFYLSKGNCGRWWLTCLMNKSEKAQSKMLNLSRGVFRLLVALWSTAPLVGMSTRAWGQCHEGLHSSQNFTLVTVEQLLVVTC